MFIINLIPLHVFVLILMGRFSNRIYTAYTTFFILGLVLSMQIPFVGKLAVIWLKFMSIASSKIYFLRIPACPHQRAHGLFGSFCIAECRRSSSLPSVKTLLFRDQIRLHHWSLDRRGRCFLCCRSFDLRWNNCTMEWKVNC